MQKMRTTDRILNKIYNRNFLRESFLVLILAVIFWLPRGLSLDSFVSTDEIAWLVRSANFYYALGQRDFDNTHQNKSPGVTTMWVNTAAFLIEYPEYRGMGQGQFESFPRFDRFTASKNIDSHKILVTGRSIMVIIHTFLLLVGFFLARRLIGFLPAIFGFILLSLEPYFIGLTRLSHLDALVGTTSMVSILALMVYAFDEQKVRFLVISAVAASLASLTKITGFIVLPGIGIIFLLGLFFQYNDLRDESRQEKWQWYRKIILNIFIFIVVYLLIYFVIWPAMWTNPIERFIGQIGKPENFLPESDVLTNSLIGETEKSTLKKSIDWFLYVYKYFWRATPVHFVGLVLLGFFLVTRKNLLSKSNVQKVCWSLLIVALIFTILLTIPYKQNFRYWIPAYICLSLLSGIGWYAMISSIMVLVPKQKVVILSLIVSCIFLIQLWGVFQTFPYYVTYYNPLMGGGKQAGKKISIGEGEGLDQAGRYLSTLPNADNLTVMSWYGWGSFSYFFSGKTIIFPVTGIWSKGLADKLRESDYLVTYSNQWSRRIPHTLLDQIKGISPVETIWINGIQFVRIYKVTDLPAEVFTP